MKAGLNEAAVGWAPSESAGGAVTIDATAGLAAVSGERFVCQWRWRLRIACNDSLGFATQARMIHLLDKIDRARLAWRSSRARCQQI
jgi:hypothetical protein